MSNEIKNLSDCALPVYTSIQEKPPLAGVGEIALYGIIFLTLMLMMIINNWCVIIGIVAYLACRIICKKEPLMIDFIFENMSSSEIYEG